MRIIRVVLIALALLLLLVVIAVVALVSPAGQRTVQNAFNSWATERLGRSANIDGVLTLQLGREIVINATKVRLANVGWGSRPDMFVADRVSFRVDGMPLLSRSPAVIVDEVDIDGLDLLLERNDDGVNNWSFPRPAETSGTSWLSALPVFVDRVSLPGARIRFIGPRLDRPLDVNFEQITQQRGAGDMLEFAASGRANDADLSITGQIGPFANLVAGKAISTSIDGHLGQLNLAIRARIDDIERPVDSEADLEVRGPDAAYIATTFGVRNLGDGPFNFTLSVSPAPDGEGVRGSVVGQIGQFDISGDGELSEPTDMGKLTLRTEISGPDVSLLAGMVGFELPPEQFRLAATIRRTGTLLEIDQANLELPDSAFSVQGSVKRIDNLSGNDLTVHLVGAKVEKFRKLLHIPGLATGPFEVNVRLHPSDTGQDLLQLTSKTALLDLTASGSLGDYPEFYGTRVRFTARGDDIRPWAQTLGVTAPRAAFSTQGQAEWSKAGVELRAATLTAGADTLNLDGVIGTSKTSTSNLRFGLHGRRLSDVAAYVRWSDFPAQPYKAAGTLVIQNGRTRLDGVDVSAAGARLQVGGAIGSSPSWRGTTLNFTLSGTDFSPFKALAQGYELPVGAFQASGIFQYGDERVRLQNVGVTAAGSEAQVTADLALPLGATVGNQPNRIDVHASGPDLRLLVPDMPDSSVIRQKFDLKIDGSWMFDKWTFDTLHFEVPGGFLSLRGRLDRAPDFSATALTVSARTVDLETTGRLFGLHLPAQPLDVAAVITGTPTAFRMEGLSGHFGKTDFVGSIGLDLTSKPDLDIRLTSNFLDLTPLTDVVGNQMPTTTVRLDSKSIPNLALPLELLNEVNGIASIQSTTTSFLGQTYDHLEVHGFLRDGQLAVDPLAFGSTDGNLNARIAIGTNLNAPNVRLFANGDQIRLAVVPGMNTTAAASLYKVQIDVAATGRNLRDLAATLNGRIRLEGAGGRVPNSRMNQALTSDFLGELARTLNPLSKRQEYTDVVCQAYLFEAERGALRTDPAIVIRTKELDIVSTGSVDLSSEKVDFNFKTAARGGLGFSAGELFNSYVKVSGTLSKPYLTVDPTGTLVNGGAAFATGGLSILATTLWDRVTRQKDPCAAAVAEADRKAQTKKRWW
jgi:uncharacterized protein involved in outer membrane biogenesis